MNYLLDTCVVSELMKPRPDQNLIHWLQSVPEYSLHLSVLTFGEIHQGIERLAPGSKRERLHQWVNHDLQDRFQGRILDLDLDVARTWGRIQGQAEGQGAPLSLMDGLLAATAVTRGLIMVTHNTQDRLNSGVTLLNPWESIKQPGWTGTICPESDSAAPRS